MKHGEEGTHSVCNKHFALLGGKSTCCVCGEKKDCSNTPSPKPCCAFSGKKCCDKCRYPYQEKGVDCEHTAACNFCPCHQSKPEVSPEKKDKCEDSQCFDANCSTHGIHPTPPEKKCKKCGVVDSSGLTPRTNSAICYPHEWVDFSPAKEEKEVCTCASFFTVRGTHKKDCPTLTEQKGEWEEEFDKKFPALWHELGHDDLILKTDEVKSFIAAKKKEWEAQKEQAVKAEIREKVRNLKTTETRGADEYNNALDEVLDLLSDKVTH